MAKYAIDDTTLTGIADAIRKRDGTTDPILVSDLAARVTAIPENVTGTITATDDGAGNVILTVTTGGTITVGEGA